MTNIDKKIETLILDNVNQDCGCTDIGKGDLKKFALDIQKETAREKTCCCISYERGVTPCLCGCHKQLTGEDYE